MIVSPEEAGNYKCCKMDKQCEGDKCMGWVNQCTFSEEVKRDWKHLMFRPMADVPTGKGYCGHIGVLHELVC